ncbi:two-component sensor histidine kinase [Ruegeria lacuscaerulensis ITI-1157]|nr:two-component sensor histidine kinase [Ruegeria lacuscaerulensis ITI-1157]SHI71809.1 Signal transduction histidine kinase [Ruegeria lacuscaerulensis ITI-1157]
MVVGSWVSGRIVDAVVQNSANSAALYMESILSPLSQELAHSDRLSEQAARAMSELFEQQPMQERIVSFKIWKKGGMIAHASNPDIIGEKFQPTDDLRRAWAGTISGSFEQLDRAENSPEAALGVPLLEVYSPIREIWSGEIIAVGEFYQRADRLRRDLIAAKRTSWLVVATTFGISTLVLYLIVAVGDRTIRSQASLLETRLAESQQMSRQNEDLRARVIEAAERSSAQTDRFLRKLGSELHDGPAQYLALAMLRLESAFPPERGPKDAADDIHQSLQNALTEIRALSRGLAAPDIDALSLEDVIDRAVSDHHSPSSTPEVSLSGHPSPELSYAEKLCVFRFVQETLSNAARHAPGASTSVSCHVETRKIAVTVHDDGPGFDPARTVKLGPEGGQGLMGLRDRIESIGGKLEIFSAPMQGTTIKMTLFQGQVRAS